MRFNREISVSSINPISTSDLTTFLRRVQPPSGARILDIGGTTSFWSGLDRQVHPLSITLINLPGLVDIQEPESSIHVIHGNLSNLTALVTDRAIDVDVVICRGILEHIEDQRQQRALAQTIRALGRGYWVQTAQTPSLFYRVWSGSSHLDFDDTDDTEKKKPSWIGAMPPETSLDRPGLSQLFPDAAGIVTLRQIWFETSYAAYRAC